MCKALVISSRRTCVWKGMATVRAWRLNAVSCQAFELSNDTRRKSLDKITVIVGRDVLAPR